MSATPGCPSGNSVTLATAPVDPRTVRRFPRFWFAPVVAVIVAVACLYAILKVSLGRILI